VNNVSLPLFNVSSSQIMAQLPFTVTGNEPLVVRTSAGISSPFTVNIQNFAPAIFRNGSAGDQTGLATVVRLANNELVDFTNPIHPDETIAIYLTGLAQTSPAAPLGDAAPLNPLAIVSTPPTVTLGGTPLDVTFAGLVPGEVGVYQIDAAVPHGIHDAAQTSLIVTQGSASKTLQVRVVNP
jgi:acid phosphatase type 7